MKYLLLLPLLLLYVLPAEAQDEFLPETAIGVKGGANFSRFVFEPSITQEIKTGYTGGLVFKYMAQPHLGVQLEANYVQRGWTETIGTDSTFTRDLNYLELPFMTHVAFGKRTRFILNFGPNISYLISSTDSIAAIGESTDGYYQKEIDNPLMIALSLGIGMAKITSFGEFQLEARLTQGLNNVIENEQGVSTAANTSISVTLAYLLNLRRESKPSD